jgi:opacity protein-like surface antigen
MMKTGLRFAILVGGFLVSAGSSAVAQFGNPELPPAAVALNVTLGRLDGFGARAFGLGGAFTAVADDATAASWNPAGLAQLPEKQVQAGFGYLSRDSSRPKVSTLTMRLGSSAVESNAYITGLPVDQGFESSTSPYPDFVTVAFPIALGANRLVLSMSGFRMDTFFEDRRSAPRPEIINGLSAGNTNLQFRIGEYSTRFQQDGQSQTLNASAAVNFRERFLVGLTLSHVTTDYTKTSETNLQNYTMFYEGFGESASGSAWRKDTREVNATGWFATVGLQYRVTPKVTLGATYRTGSRLNLDYSEESKFTATFPINIDAGATDSKQKVISFSDSSDVTTADAFSLGLAIRPRLNWVVAIDYSWADWSDVTYKASDLNGYETDFYYPSLQPRGTGIAGEPYNSRQYKDTTFRIGTEWTFSVGDSYLPVRLGFYREDGLSSFPGGSQPSVTGITTGLGLQTSGGLFADLAIVYDTVDAKASSTGGSFDSGVIFRALPDNSLYTQLVDLSAGASIEQNTWRGVLSLGYRF